MAIEDFKQYIKKNKPHHLFHLKHIQKFEVFLINEKGKKSIDDANAQDLEDYVSQQIKVGSVPRLSGLAAYFYFKKDSSLWKAVNQIQKRLKGRHAWVDNLSEALDERVGIEIREEILQGREGLKQTSSSSKKIAFSRDVIDRMEKSINKERCKEILSCGIHRRSKGTIAK